jgi:hypothetical protein
MSNVKRVLKSSCWLAALVASTASAFALNTSERRFVQTVAFAALTRVHCDESYRIDGDSLFGGAVAEGIDVTKLLDATLAASGLLNGRGYDKAMLIPDVTSIIQQSQEQMETQLGKDRDGTCRRWLETLIGLHALKH